MTSFTPEWKPSGTQKPRGSSPSWGGLEPGPYTAGFQLTCRYDFSRLYAPPYHDGDGIRPAKRFRPILQASWYPAQGGEDASPMHYRDYFAADEVGSEFHEFLTRLFAFNLDMASRYGLHKPRAAQNPQEQAAYEAWLDTPTAAVRNAAPLSGPFPLVLYHPGLGSSYEDNAVFCEYLATHGYVVLSSAYPAEQAVGIGINGEFERSARDVQFLLNNAGVSADLERIAVMGHSYGGHTASSLRALVNSPIDAVISLDSTMEYFEPGAALWASLRARMALPERQTVPMLLFSGMQKVFTVADGSEDHVIHWELPFFDCYDALPYAQRYYAAVRHLEHPDFVSQGAWLGRVRRMLAGESAQGERIWDTYEAVCRCAHRFLDMALKQDAAAKAFLAETERSAGDAGSAIVLRIENALTPPPAPHHLIEIMVSEGTAALNALCRQYPQEIDAAALCQVAHGLLERQRGAEAISLLRLATDLHPGNADVYTDLAEALEEAGQLEEAVLCCRQALAQITADTTLDESERERATQRPAEMLRRLAGER